MAATWFYQKHHWFWIVVVPVRCKNSKYEDLEWRISFSMAEKQLIQTFTHTQMLCYAAFKIILTDIVKPKHGDLLCSYFLKTILFWLAEETDQSKWIPKYFVMCLKQCFRRLTYCVECNNCLHLLSPKSISLKTGSLILNENSYSSIHWKTCVTRIHLVFLKLGQFNFITN